MRSGGNVAKLDEPMAQLQPSAGHNADSIERIERNCRAISNFDRDMARPGRGGGRRISSGRHGCCFAGIRAGRGARKKGTERGKRTRIPNYFLACAYAPSDSQLSACSFAIRSQVTAAIMQRGE